MSDAPTSAAQLVELARVGGDARIESHRPVIGPWVVALKRAWGRLIRFGLAPLLARQEAFNRAVAARLAELDAPVPPTSDTAGQLASPEAALLSRRIELVHETLHRELHGVEAGVLRTLREELALKTSQALAAVLASAEPGSALASGFGEHLYREFVTRFRGSEEEIRARFALYTELFADAAPVLDVGCGRGEFLAALRARGIGASGVDVNAELVERCVQDGLDVTRGDALAHLRGMPAASLGGVFSAQVIEHFEPAAVQAFLGLAHRALRPGGLLIAETINAESLSAVTRNFFADWTHRTPIAPRSLRFVVESIGFEEVEIRYLSPVPEDARLRIVPIDPDLPSTTRDQLEAINRNFELLNGLLFAPQDFALVARKPRA
ncbi:MAG: class I SAM-dependent methyltransferase [bacterium]